MILCGDDHTLYRGEKNVIVIDCKLLAQKKY